MEVTGWVSFGDSNYLDFSDEIMELRNPEKKIFIDRKQIELLAKEQNKTVEEWQKDQDEIPFFIDEAKAFELQKLRDEAEKTLIDYCVSNRIFISDREHQCSDKGVPVFDNKWKLEFTLRSWSAVMAIVWNTIEKTNEYGYIDFYCGVGTPKTFSKN